ncbi:Calcium/calmodulin-dependent protein kinase [Phlyctema vagabunda]|uniref:Calcium/calmodulin-dependent protein kinase n=1 Tax=Phlyctema vagabunda TaxID=108571 RepID=A0ABR4PUP9_9HELO
MSLDSTAALDSTFGPWIAQLHFENSLTRCGLSQTIRIFADQELKVGRLREKGCTYSLTHAMVSKQHFRIYTVIYDTDSDDTAKPPLVFCEDLESTNGTYVNNELIGIYRKRTINTGYLLTDGDVIEIKPFWKFTFSQPETRGDQFPRRAATVDDDLEPNVIDLKKAFLSQDTIYMFFELAGGGDLFQHIRHEGGVLSDVHSRAVTRQIAFAMEYIHSKGVVHRDIKPENILLGRRDVGWRVILADFGLAIEAQSRLSRMESVVGTRGYTAPELSGNNATQGYTMAADVFSFGLVTLLSLTGSTTIIEPECYRNSVNEEELVYAKRAWQSISSSARSFLRCVLDPNPNKRMHAGQAVKHNWYTNPSGHGSDGADDAYQRSIKHWNGRADSVKTIEWLPGHELKKREKRKHSLRLPDTTASPYFDLSQRVESRTRSTRRQVLDELASTGQLFLTSSPGENPISDQSSPFLISRENGRDLFGTMSDIKVVPDSQETSGSTPDNLQDLEPPEICHTSIDGGAPPESTDSINAEDQVLHDTVAENLPRICSAKYFKDAVVQARGRKRVRI